MEHLYRLRAILSPYAGFCLGSSRAPGSLLCVPHTVVITVALPEHLQHSRLRPSQAQTLGRPLMLPAEMWRPRGGDAYDQEELSTTERRLRRPTWLAVRPQLTTAPQSAVKKCSGWER